MNGKLWGRNTLKMQLNKLHLVLMYVALVPMFIVVGIVSYLIGNVALVICKCTAAVQKWLIEAVNHGKEQ